MVRKGQHGFGFGWGFVAFSVLAVAASFALLTNLHPEAPIYQYRWLRCIGYLADGTLYGGQPECEQGPMVFLAGLVLSTVSGGNIEPLSVILFLLINAASALMLLKIVGSKDRLVDCALVLLYCLLILPPLLSDFASAISVLFTLLAAYAFARGSGIKAMLAVSALLVLALFSKVTSMSAIAGFLVASIVLGLFGAVRKIRGGIIIEHARLKALAGSLAAFMGPLLLALFLAWLAFPNIIVYMFLSHAHWEKLGYVDALKAMASKSPIADYNTLMFCLLLVACVLCILRFRDLFAVVFIVAYFTSFLSRLKVDGSSPGLFDSYYLVFPSVLLIVVAGNLLSKLSDRYVRVEFILFFLFAALFFGGFHMQGRPSLAQSVLALTGEYREQAAMSQRLGAQLALLRHEFDGYYMFLPPNSGPVLTEPEVYGILRNLTTPLNMSLVEERSNPPTVNRYFDEAFGVGLMYHNVTKTKYFPIDPHEEALARQIEADRYGMIFIGTDEGSQIVYAWRNTSRAAIGRYCAVYVPVLHTEKLMRYHWFAFYFNETEECKAYRSDVVKYSNLIFDDVCSKDEWAANSIIDKVIVINAAESRAYNGTGPPPIKKLCQSKSDLIGLYDKFSDTRPLMQKIRAAVLLACAATIALNYAIAAIRQRMGKRDKTGTGRRTGKAMK